MKNLLTAIVIFTLALCTSTSFSQTYKPDFATKVVLAGNGSDLTNTMTLLAPTNALGGISLTLPNTLGSAGKILTWGAGGQLSWSTAGVASITPSVTNNQFLTTDNTGAVAWQTIQINATNLSGNGLNTPLNVVTGAITVPSIFTTTGTGNAVGGSYAVSLATQAANTIFAGPAAAGPAAAPTFRALALADLPGTGAITVNGGTGLGVAGSPVSLGGTLTLSNTGVTSNVAGSGINVSGATGAVTISNTGVLSAIGTANQVNVSGATGNVTFSLPQDIHSGASPTFTGLTLSSLTQQPGVVHNSAAGVLSSGPVALGSGGDVSGILLPANGGTGVANANTSTLTLGGPVTFAGAFATTINVSAATNVTLPTSGTILSSGGGLNTNGVLYASSASSIASTTVGNAGEVLTSNGAGLAPTFQTPGSTITFSPSTTNNFAGNTNNYAINGTNTVYYLQNSTGGAVDLTGLVASTPGRLIVLVNNSAAAADVIVLKDKNIGSTNVNQFHLQGASDVLLGVDGTVTLIYDATATNSTGATGAWRVIANY
jgi:hypothetical protein